ncbi:hypothetical protein FHX37_4581 [Haloactinospora alba]|uniref:Uncharacterized protein n=1 Tax=Haloactinospora alba TaxID=405555 RepID=A0A543N7R4_9ACTN|nr:hypothetical protein [Haloactinospora alba]TQN27850.1 hypothetical protein FHX37_4581 [Haloactinospora alba]
MRTLDALQGVVAIAGITVGVIPLALWMLNGKHSGAFRLLFGSPDAPIAYTIPLLVIAACVALIALLERAKRSS